MVQGSATASLVYGSLQFFYPNFIEQESKTFQPGPADTQVLEKGLILSPGRKSLFSSKQPRGASDLVS